MPTTASSRRHSSSARSTRKQPPKGDRRSSVSLLVVLAAGAWLSTPDDSLGSTPFHFPLPVPAVSDTSHARQAARSQVKAGQKQPTLADAQRLLYNARYEAAATLALALRASAPDDLANYELRTSALLFQLRSILERTTDRPMAFDDCLACPDLLAAFLADIRRGQAIARARLERDPHDQSALFFLGKLDLNYVWLQLGPLRRKKGWNEYSEGRKSLDAVLQQNPQHVRARVTRAWVEYVIATKLPRGTHWLVGGGSREHALAEMRRAATSDTDTFAHAEARFGLWEILIRERRVGEAVDVARSLAHEFPENSALLRFLERRGSAVTE